MMKMEMEKKLNVFQDNSNRVVLKTSVAAQLSYLRVRSRAQSRPVIQRAAAFTQVKPGGEGL